MRNIKFLSYLILKSKDFTHVCAGIHLVITQIEGWLKSTTPHKVMCSNTPKYRMVQYIAIYYNKHATWHSLTVDEVFMIYLLIKILCRIDSDITRLTMPSCSKQQLLSMQEWFKQSMARWKRFLNVKYFPFGKGHNF